MNPAQRDFIEKLYIEMFDRLMIYARASLKSETLAEEAVQETFGIACQRVDVLQSSESPQGWLVLTLRNTVWSMKRQIDATKRLIEDCLLEAKGSEDRLPLHLLYEDVVHTEEFILLSEMALEGKSHKEMAAARGITVNTCKKRVQRAREMLQKKIKK